MIYNAGLGYYIESIREFADPYRGVGIEHVYGGNEAALRGLAAQFEQQGIYVDLSHRGVKWQLIVFYASRTEYDGSVEDPVEEWEVDANLQEIDLFETGKAYQAIKAEKDASEEVEDVIANMQSALDEKDSATRATKEALFESSTERPNTWKIYQLKRAGVESIQLAQPMVRQNRTVSYNYAQPFVIDPSPNAYLTATFFAGFSVPSIIQSKLPTQAALNALDKPDNTTWAYYQLSHTATAELRTGKIREVREWVLGAVSTVLYDIT